MAGEVAGWDVPTLLLFGKDEAAQCPPLPSRVYWVLKDADGTARKREELEAVLRAKLPDVSARSTQFAPRQARFTNN